MAKKNDRFKKQCCCCSKIYEYCPTCSRFAHLPRWMDAYCSENCKELYNITAGFINGWKTPEVEAARLKERDLSYMDKLPQWMQDTIKDIQKVDTTNADAINQALNIDNKEQTVVEEATVEETATKEADQKQTVSESAKEEPAAEVKVAQEEPAVKEEKKSENLGERIHNEFKETSKTVKRYKPKENYSKK